ncbi:hypothetical protein [Arthrobacter sp. A5]|uniref:hypothetical protein n=1 Tax=Arthrobacter sp. A5 TaxID=576926 RepID=UPI003DA8709A
MEFATFRHVLPTLFASHPVPAHGVRHMPERSCRHQRCPKIFRATFNGVALDIQATHEAVIIMSPCTSEAFETPDTTVDQFLTRRPDHDIPVDQLMRAVEGVRPYVKIHLGKFGFCDGVDVGASCAFNPRTLSQ